MPPPLRAEALSRVLFVEDDTFVLGEFASQLEDLRVTVVKATTVAEAAKFLEADDFDALVTDLKVPDGEPNAIGDTFAGSMSGLAIARAFRARYPYVAIVLLSGSKNRQAMDWCSQNDAKYYLKGEIKPTEFTRSIAELSRTSRRSRLSHVSSILGRFGRLGEGVSSRKSGRQGFAITNEYDLQELLAIVLNYEGIEFQLEEPIGSTASKSARVDFLLPGLRIVIETKYMKTGFTEKRLGQELIDDSVKYRKAGNCDLVIFFVRDSEKSIVSPSSFASRISRDLSTPTLTAEVVFW